MDDLTRLQVALTGRYTVEVELGRGGMATVYLASDLKHHRRVAIKVLRPEIAAALGPERFLREIETAARLNHPHILSLHDSGEANGLLYYVMPYVEGETLRERLKRENQLALDDVLQITREVADALGYAHSLGLVHRDIKPENILFQAGHAVVSDFGIARAVSISGREQLTATGIAVGTPAYMSPQQAAGVRELDPRSDLYSLGCVVYEMLVGEPPFTGPSAQAVLARHTLDPVPPLRTVRKSVPAHVERAVMKALEKVPADRFRTASEFAAAICSAVGPEPPDEPPRKPGRAAPLVTAEIPTRRPRDDEIEAYGLTHPGKVLTVNQDHFFVYSLRKRVEVHISSLPPNQTLRLEAERLAYVAMVADGVGGGSTSEEANRLAMETITEYVSHAIHCCYTKDTADDRTFAAALQEAASRCHLELARRGPGRRALSTSLTLWIGVWPRSYFLQVGQSRGYLLRGTLLTQVTRDQELPRRVGRSVRSKRDVQDKGLEPGLAIGIDGSPAPVITTLDQHWNDVGMLCTDGLTKHVSDDRIRERLSSLTSAKQACEDLLQDALDAGGTDNISILIGRSVRRD